MKPTPKAIENAARAMLASVKWSSFWSPEDARALAQAALSGDLGDMVLVPKEATEAVLDRAGSFALKSTIDGDYRWRDYMRDLYRVMIAAAEGESCK